ncbi:bifunctional helix-turn-helix transcriptional regulator/GNAT family N-acetyltransferase [Nitrincola alkalilacustris]|uniref:bifunctional helix-turn-helix transcriptional regulator/GNAT family N-acetyltransferase n=1 Tax=Nitrincola alkalilacustris TaxID=1571224 RepID=UPI00124D3543|nr:helix-turn-helix domain-containing GNAT family N-acetyltransferase [Nitrincola alkalilacustris]
MNSQTESSTGLVNQAAASPSADCQASRVSAVRRFNRFYTQVIGVLHEGLLDSPFSLTEVRVLYELAHSADPTAAALCQALSLDAGYLSRILQRFDKEGLIHKRRSEQDARQSHLSLTEAGQQVFEELSQRSSQEITDLLQALPDTDQQKLIESMQSVEQLLSRDHKVHAPVILRQHRPGDMGWVVWRHGIYYAREFGWNEGFEALVAKLVADFVQNYKPEHERCWIAECDGRNVGSIFLVQESESVARLRMLYIEPEMRGLGLGRRLVEECVNTARQLGYRKMVLWTNAGLHAARHIYEAQGFKLLSEETVSSFGRDEIYQDWELIF